MVIRLLGFLRLAIFLILLISVFLSLNTKAVSSTVVVLRVEGNIVPVVNDYIHRGLDQAEAKGAAVVIIELNTPGGLYNSTQKIVERILNAKVPVVVYVSPAGGWAGSAGTFITLSSHIAAMAPGSRIGAATPVAMGQEIPQEAKKKISEDAAAFIRSIAQMRGRDPHHAELAVREGKSYTVDEALKYKLVDIKATDLNDLITQLDGRKVILVTEKEVVLDTKKYAIENIRMTGIERFLHTISDPNIAYILLSLATIGLMAELYNPGLIFPGVFGGISLLLAFYSLGVLNAYWGGILLILLAYGLFVAELFVTSHGILASGGIASLTFGSLILFSRSSPPMEINRGLIAIVVLFMSAFLAFLLWAVVRAQKRKVVTGAEGLIGKIAIAQTSLAPKGIVLIEGERWTAIINGGKVEAGEEVVVTKVEGLTLRVTKNLEKGGK